jgi:hypothetical protein
MFDLSFYASVSGFVKYVNELMHDTMPNPDSYGRVGINNYFKVCSLQYFYNQGKLLIFFVMQTDSYHFTHDNFYFKYYMKVYFKYFNLNIQVHLTSEFFHYVYNLSRFPELWFSL